MTVMYPKFWQGNRLWAKELLGDGTARMAGAGCVVTTQAILLKLLAPEKYEEFTPLDVLKTLREIPGAFVGPNGSPPGSLLVWPVALQPFGFACDEAMASASDDEGSLHDFAGQMVDSNAELAGVLAAAMVGGAAAVRVDHNGDGKGDHTIACVGRSEDGKFICSDPALNAIITLDENLENPDIHWGSTSHPYRAVGIRAVRLA